MASRPYLLSGAAALSFALSACGGGGGGGTSFIPTPPATPTPTPTPSGGPLPPPHLGLISAQAFAALGVADSYSIDVSGSDRQAVSGPSAVNVQFSYNASSNTYQISLPSFQPGTLAATAYNGTAGEVADASVSSVTAGSSSTLQPVSVRLLVPEPASVRTATPVSDPGTVRSASHPVA